MIRLELVSQNSRLVALYDSDSQWKVRSHPSSVILASKDLVPLAVTQLKDYRRFTFFLEDVIVVSPRPNELVVFNSVSAESVECLCDEHELEAVLAVSIMGGDNYPDEEKHIALLERLMREWPKECNFLP